jgi:phosphatidylethanolamine-binding protein (PEBP) family uncharacterized protein
MKRFLTAALIACCLPVAGYAADFEISFDWGDIPLCTSGRPNVVPSPVFKLKNLPEGTNKVVFKLKDLDVPQYNHGGGTVKLSSGGTMPGGVFKYKSPCPPDGPHTYEWTATAKKGGKTLAKASASKVYPK